MTTTTTLDAAATTKRYMALEDWEERMIRRIRQLRRTPTQYVIIDIDGLELRAVANGERLTQNGNVS